MDQDKPFKTIEVIDSKTRQPCKVACMSCIRGHRTTSCGIPVCRSKIFWTVKRPGRPSNSCTCRFGGTGRCQCVVAKSACPHKPKKGEKRTVDCRCDEQGRFCCLLEPEHWDALCALQKPIVTFYPDREALDARPMVPPAIAFPPTPSYSVGTPQTVSSVPSTPGPMNGLQFVNTTPPNFTEAQSPATHVPRFGMMGVGTPWGNGGFHGQDVLVWEGKSPQAPREYHSYAALHPQEAMLIPDPVPVVTEEAHQTYPASSDPPTHNPEFAPVTQSMEQMSMPSEGLPSSTFDFDKMMTDYFNYQFPAAICQHCGLNGCTCKNCPPTLQSFESGSWAQCCARKHVQMPSSRPHILDEASGAPHAMTAGLESDPTFSQEMQVDDLTDGIDLSEFLVNDLEQPKGGCCCGDP